jgi:subtilisin family serine protease
MKTLIKILALQIGILAMAHLIQADTPAQMLLVKWKGGGESDAARNANAMLGSRVKRQFDQTGWQLVVLSSEISTSDAIRRYRMAPDVLATELPPAAISTARSKIQESPVAPPGSLRGLGITVPNDPRYREQWNLQQIGAPDAWTVATGSTNIVIAILDSGVDYTHPDLADNMWHNPGESGIDANGQDKATNGIDDDGNGYIDDVVGADVARGSGDPMDTGYFFPPSTPFYHGTFCAGIIAAAGNNTLGIAGINWSARMMAVAIFGGDVTDLNGHSDFPFYENILAGLDYVLMMKRRGVNIRVANNSYYTFIPGAALADAVTALSQEEVLCVFAAGNDALDLDQYSSFPGCFNLPNLIVVANTDRSGALNSGSSFGKSTVDLAAPGTDILSTKPGGLYVTATGTSFSTPTVAGAAALLLSANPNLTVEELKAALFGSVDQLPALKGKVVTNGRLNVGRAIQLLNEQNSAPIVTTALPAGQRTPTDIGIHATFSRPMDHASVEGAFSIKPPLQGSFFWSDDGRWFTYIHAAPLDPGTNYTVRIAGTAKDTAGRMLDGNFNRVSEGSPADDFIWTFRFPVANDDFANAAPLLGTSGKVRGNNSSTMWDPGEPQPIERGAQIRGNTVWYRFVPPPEGGWFTFDLTAPFDSLLDVFIGSDLPSLTSVAENDNYGTRRGSRISLMTEAGTNYTLRVAGKNPYSLSGFGAFDLSWYPTPPPGFTGSQFLPSSAAPGAMLTLIGTNFTGATAVLFNGVPSSFDNASANNLDLRITATVPANAISGPITIITPHGNVTSTSTFIVRRPELSFSRPASNQILLTWTDSSFLLESSADLLAWAVASPGGSTNFVTTLVAPQAFFRLRKL